LLGVYYVRPFSDGRVGAVLVVDDPAAPSPAEPIFAVFVHDGTRWILDATPRIFVLEEESSVRLIEATPSP